MAQHDGIMQFPLDFPIKVMGLNQPEFAPAIVALVQRHAGDYDPAEMQTRHSREGTYLGLTLTIRATSREQLDNLYRELSAHPMVKTAL